MSTVGPTIDVRCSQCGAGPGESCRWISGEGTPETAPGTERPDLHFYRTRLPRRPDDPDDPLDRPPVDHGSDRHGYVELTYDVPVRWPVPIPSHDLLESLRCEDCLPNLFLRWDGSQWHPTIAHDDGCPALAVRGLA